MNLLMGGSALCNFGMPAPNCHMHNNFKHDMNYTASVSETTKYDLNALNDIVPVNVPNLNAQQMKVDNTFSFWMCLMVELEKYS